MSRTRIGQEEVHGGALVGLALDPDAAAAAGEVVVFLDDVAAEDEAEAVVGAGFVGLEEVVALLGGHAAAGVGDGDVDHAVGRVDGGDGHAALLGVLQGVVDEVVL